MALMLVARDRGFVNKHPETIEDGRVTSWKPGVVHEDDVFEWHYSFPVDDYDEATQLALLPLWCDAQDPEIQEKLVDLRSDPEAVQEIRRRVSKHRAGRTTGGFDPYRRHANLDQARQQAKLAAKRAAVAPAAPVAATPEPASELADGIHAGGAGWYTVKVGETVEKVRGEDAANELLQRLEAGATMESRASDAAPA